MPFALKPLSQRARLSRSGSGRCMPHSGVAVTPSPYRQISEIKSYSSYRKKDQDYLSTYGMSDFSVVDPKGWECDLQSVYSAYMGYFQLHSVPWYERSWGVFFESFDEFLTFAWPVITVTDSWTGRAHIVTRPTSIGAFIKMVKTRFGETLPLIDNILRVTPFETSQRHLRTVSDYASYKKLHATLPAAYLAALKLRVRSGEPRAIRELWSARNKTFLSIDFEWLERNTSSCLEWGYAAVRCGHLEGVGTWPPDPEPNYRRGHYIVGEYVDKVHNKYRPNFPWAYVFGESQVVPKAKLAQVISAIISSLASPDQKRLLIPWCSLGTASAET
ncbi:hypothetical protein B0H21DRAFT_409805 [Amylocystis lapponica]|nr:hypothetical protein B0H21DRAFT_409805 [Amylocystis lapponica]